METCKYHLLESIELMQETNRNSLIDRLSIVLGTGLGIGFAPIAPGTFGSLLGPPLVWGVLQAGLPVIAVLAIAAVFIAVGIPICTAASAALGKHDPGQVVYDEIAAFWIVFLPHIECSTSPNPGRSVVLKSCPTDRESWQTIWLPALLPPLACLLLKKLSSDTFDWFFRLNESHAAVPYPH
jgi:phosphatidylglycerophosphatase A